MNQLVHVLERQLPMSHETMMCVPFHRGETLQRALRRDTFDLLILDWNVPDFDGLELLSWLRKQQENSVPVLMLSARTSERDVSDALSAGADDYMAKPLRSLELVARIRRLLARRHFAPTASPEDFGRWVFDRSSSTVHIDANVVASAHRVKLSESEFRLATVLFRNIGRAVSRSYLLECVGYPGDTPTRALDSQIYRLRVKLALNAANGLRLRTVYGLGYRLELSVDAEPDV